MPDPAAATSRIVNIVSEPSNVKAEQALLGTLLLHNRVYESVGEILKPEHFADPGTAEVYRAAQDLLEKNQPATPITLKSVWGHPVIAQAGGGAYIAGLCSSAGTPSQAKAYAEVIFDLWQRRELVRVGERLTLDAMDSPASEAREAAEQALFELTCGEAGGPAPLDAALTGALRMAEAAHRRKGQLQGVTTGLRDLDEKLGGLHPSDLIILAGRPSQGKTACGLTVAFNAARAQSKKRVVFFSLEMSKEQLAMRILADKADVSGHDLRTGFVPETDFQRVPEAVHSLAGTGLDIDDTPAPTVGMIRNRCRKIARTEGLALVVVDYLQLITPGKAENRVQEVAGMTRALKGLAKELSVPVVVLSQLSRAVEQRDDKRPQLSDLRESGTIEQDADVVMFVFREEYYLERKEPPEREAEAYNEWKESVSAVKNIAELIVAKQRHGPIGVVQTYFDASRTWFRDLKR